MWFSGEGGGRDSGESLKGFGNVLNSGLAKQICQGTPRLTVGKKDSVRTVPVPISVGLWRPEVSGWNLQNFILELWRNTALSSDLCVIRKVVLGSMIQKQEA